MNQVHVVLVCFTLISVLPSSIASAIDSNDDMDDTHRGRAIIQYPTSFISRTNLPDGTSENNAFDPPNAYELKEFFASVRDFLRRK